MGRSRPGRGTEAIKRWSEVPTGRCTAHVKILYKSRKQARQAVRSLGERPTEMDVYPCVTVADHWHIGHDRQDRYKGRNGS
jgi:hypothetical protein